MATLNKSLVSDYQTTSLAEKIHQTTNGVDLNWRGYSVKNQDQTKVYNVTSFVGGSETFSENSDGGYTFERYGDEANFNRAVAWLASKNGDYVRSSSTGSGLLYTLLGKNVNENELDKIADQVTSAFNQDFLGDMEMVSLNLTLNSKNKKVIITMIVRDLTTNRVGSQSLSVRYDNEVI